MHPVKYKMPTSTLAATSILAILLLGLPTRRAGHTDSVLEVRSTHPSRPWLIHSAVFQKSRIGMDATSIQQKALQNDGLSVANPQDILRERTNQRFIWESLKEDMRCHHFSLRKKAEALRGGHAGEEEEASGEKSFGGGKQYLVESNKSYWQQHDQAPRKARNTRNISVSRDWLTRDIHTDKGSSSKLPDGWVEIYDEKEKRP
jgi:hypothetical protein